MRRSSSTRQGRRSSRGGRRGRGVASTSTARSNNTSNQSSIYFDRYQASSDDDSDDEVEYVYASFGRPMWQYESDSETDSDVETFVPRRLVEPPAPPPPPPKELPLCRFFVLGKCKYGSHCTYSHVLPPTASDHIGSESDGLSAAAALVDCPFFQRGNCKYGDYCRLRHANASSDAAPSPTTEPLVARQPTITPNSRTARVSRPDRPESEQPPPSNQQEFTCGICFEDIVQSGKHFGLLDCDHCFCLDCLRAWRQSKDMEVEVIRSCPACRQPSNFIVPSLTFCTGDAKREVVEAYKAHLALRECKYFNGTFGSCPFGPHCFYAHRDSHGHDVKHLDRPKRAARRSRRFGRGGVTEETFASMLSSYSDLLRFLEMVEMDDDEDDSE